MAKEKKPEAAEVRVMEVRRTTLVEKEESKHRYIFEKEAVGWVWKTPESSQFSIQQVEDALEQLKKLEENNG